MSVEELIKLFLDKTGYLENDKVLGIVVYGSRVRKTNQESSDLDVLILADVLKNYKASMVVEGICVDYNIFAVYDLYSVCYEKKLNNNAYFESVLKTGMVIKNKDHIIEQLESYMDELEDVKVGKKKLPSKLLIEIRELYYDFIENKNIASYYYLLEKLRIAYNIQKGCSYLSMVKVYDVFMNKKFYEDAYSIQLPDERFISMFLEGVTASTYEIQVEIIDGLLKMMGIRLDNELYSTQDDFSYASTDEIKRELVILHNKLEKTIQFLRECHPYALYTYYVTLRQMRDFYKKVYGIENEEILRALDCSFDTSYEEKIKIIKGIFGLVENDYRLDYGNYMLKLEL